jgi:predicted flap endonuclease-1-like 5' DNA nuclease
MADSITKVHGIEATHAKHLKDAGIETTADLLKEAGPTQGRRALAGKVGVEPATLLEWVNRADLMRIDGIGSEYADLLEESGVDSTRELANRVPATLQGKLGEINQKKHLVQRVPAMSQVEQWVSDARRLPQVVSH